MINPIFKKYARRMFAVAVVFTALSTQFAYAQLVTVDDVQITPSPKGFTVVLDLSGAASYEFFRLGGPERLVLDIARARFNADPILLTDFAGTPVIGLRHALRNKDDLRVVIDLPEGNYRTQYLTLPPDLANDLGFRLVLNVAQLVDEKAEAPAAAPVEARQSEMVEVIVGPDDSLRAPLTRSSGQLAPSGDLSAGRGSPAAAVNATASVSSTKKEQERPRSGPSVDFSGTWQHEWAWSTEASRSQKLEPTVQPRWNLRFANGVGLTAIMRLRSDGTGELGPMDRRPPN